MKILKIYSRYDAVAEVQKSRAAIFATNYTFSREYILCESYLLVKKLSVNKNDFNIISYGFDNSVIKQGGDLWDFCKKFEINRT